MNCKNIPKLVSCLLPLVSTVSHAAVNKPNVVLILVDDLGWSDFGCYGSEIKTTTIDSLASKGIKYRQFYNAARSSPTRCSILIGLYTQQVAVDPPTSLPNLRPDNNLTIAELLGNNGFLPSGNYLLKVQWTNGMYKYNLHFKNTKIEKAYEIKFFYIA